jgi:hypothetical protein
MIFSERALAAAREKLVAWVIGAMLADPQALSPRAS